MTTILYLMLMGWGNPGCPERWTCESGTSLARFSTRPEDEIIAQAKKFPQATILALRCRTREAQFPLAAGTVSWDGTWRSTQTFYCVVPGADECAWFPVKLGRTEPKDVLVEAKP